MTKNYVEQATDPRQYDRPGLDWRVSGAEDSPSRKYFQAELEPILGDLSGKSVLDIGSGVGQLFPLLKQKGAAFVEGIEPSKRNVETCRQHYPDTTVQEIDLQHFETEKQFDVVTVIMVLEHILDISTAFEKIHSLLKGNGKLFLVVGEKEWHIRSRPGVQKEIEDLGDGTVATKTAGEYILYDILRPIEATIAAAQKAGFVLEKRRELHGPIPPDVPFSSIPICHLLVFNKQT